MAQKRDNAFLTGLLQGMYQGGVGNPSVNQANNASQIEKAYKQKELDLKANEQGMVPASPGVNPDGTLHEEHPVMKNFMSFLYPGSSTGKSLSTAYKPDPQRGQYYQNKEGKVGVTGGDQPVPSDAFKIPYEKGVTQLGSQGRSGGSTVKVAIDNSVTPSKMRILNEGESPRQGELVREMKTAEALRGGSFEEMTSARRKMADIMERGQNLKERVATFGGEFGKKQQSLNMTLGHISSASKAYDRLSQTDERFLNVPINELRRQTDNPDVVALDTAINALRGEASNVFKSGGATDQEISTWSKVIDPNLTPSQFVSTMGELSDLLGSRMDALQFQQKKVAGKDVGDPLTDKARKTKDKFGATPGPSPKATLRWNPLTNELEPIK